MNPNSRWTHFCSWAPLWPALHYLYIPSHANFHLTFIWLRLNEWDKSALHLICHRNRDRSQKKNGITVSWWLDMQLGNC